MLNYPYIFTNDNFKSMITNYCIEKMFFFKDEDEEKAELLMMHFSRSLSASFTCIVHEISFLYRKMTFGLSFWASNGSYWWGLARAWACGPGFIIVYTI